MLATPHRTGSSTRSSGLESYAALAAKAVRLSGAAMMSFGLGQPIGGNRRQTVSHASGESYRHDVPTFDIAIFT